MSRTIQPGKYGTRDFGSLGIAVKDLLGEANLCAQQFYQELRREVMVGNPALDKAAQARLRTHYPVMMSPQQNPPELAAAIYGERRQYPVAAILETEQAVVLDAGCAFGSESFLFASLGARVLAVDNDAEKIRIARLRQPYFEELFQCALDITWIVADLNEHTPDAQNISLTWLASVLAAIPAQDDFLKRVYAATRDGGRLMVTDMNLWNPLFLAGEYRRRKRATAENAAFARVQNFRAMFTRRGRTGARYFAENGVTFDDVQFLQPRSLRRLLEAAGWRQAGVFFSGYLPPRLARLGLTPLEGIFGRLPLLSRMGYFYLGVGVK